MSSSSPNKSLLVLGSSADHDVEADGDSKHAHRSSKKAERKRQKKERKERERVLNLTEQQAADSTMAEPELVEESDSQEHTVVTKREPETHVEELADSQDIVPKKRKKHSRPETPNGLERKSKKRKNSYDEPNDIATEQEESAHNHAIDEPEDSGTNEVNLNHLAEQFYSSRKKRAHAHAADGGSGIAAEAGPDSSINGVDVKGRYPSAENTGEPIENESHSRENANQSSDDGLNSILKAPPPESDASVHDADGEEPATGIKSGESIDQRDQNEVELNGEIIASESNGHVDDDIEIPSSVPHPNSARNSTTKRSAGQKRVAKRDFFRRLEDAIDENASSQSPSAAASQRKGTKGKTLATPSTRNGKAKAPKISSMLRSSPAGDGAAMTPSADSARQMGVSGTPSTVSGAFSEPEIRNITQAVERFRDDNQMTQIEVNELIHGNPKEYRASDLWVSIMETCPGRNRQKVINLTRRKFHNFVARGTWTPEQDEELKRMSELHGNKYSVIGQAINRHPEDIRDRIRNYIVCGDNMRKDQWDDDETKRLVMIVEDAIAEIRRMRPEGDDRPVDEDINWQLVSVGMGRTRSRLQCIAKWKAIRGHRKGDMDNEVVPLEEIIKQAQNTAATMSFRNRAVVIKAILNSGAPTDSRIPWRKVCTKLKGQWTRAPLIVVWVRLRSTLPHWQTLTVPEICTLLLQRFQNTHQLEYPSETGTADEEAEYRDVEYKLQRIRRHKSRSTPSSTAFVGKESSDSDGDGEAQDGEEEVAEEPETSQESRPRSVDLGSAVARSREREIEDSEPEDKKHSPKKRSRRPPSSKGRPKPKVLNYDSDNQSSDTNASQVSSIPAR